MNNPEIKEILTKLGEYVPPASRLILVGGSALALLGNPRQTIDIDFIGDDIQPEALHRQLLQLARELKFHMEPVPLERFIPLPAGSDERTIHIGQFGNLEVYVADPYSIALSKLDRGLDTDLDDIVFLIQREYISLENLEQILKTAMPLAGKYDFHPEILAHFTELKERLSR